VDWVHAASSTASKEVEANLQDRDMNVDLFESGDQPETRLGDGLF
jgi:hypothetical protein